MSKQSPFENALANVIYQILRRAGVSSGSAKRAAKLATPAIENFLESSELGTTSDELATKLENFSLPLGKEPSVLVDLLIAQIEKLSHEGATFKAEQNRLQRTRRAMNRALRPPASEQPTAPSRDACPRAAASAPPAGRASSEVIQEVGDLTTLLLGSSPAFAQAMRLQTDAIAGSLAALNKVGDAQRQDALNMAIAARSAKAQFDSLNQSDAPPPAAPAAPPAASPAPPPKA